MTYLQLITAVLVPIVGGWSSSIVMSGKVRRAGGKAWYQIIRKPVWTPRNAVFAPVWVVLYTTMGIASYVVYTSSDDIDSTKLPLTLYGMQLLLNFAWTPIFFGLNWLRTAFFEMLLLDLATLVCTYYFYNISTTAALLMCPYLAWLAFATCLNFAVWKMNLEPVLTDKFKADAKGYSVLFKPL